MGKWEGYHRLACFGFTDAVVMAEGHWDQPTPCPEWDAGAVVEHVIGFHDVLLLRPLAAKPQRPRGDPRARWEVTALAIDTALSAADRHSGVDLERLLPALVTEVLVHTWDLNRAVGADVALDGELCRVVLEAMVGNESGLRTSGMFSAAVVVSDQAPIVDRLIALSGRDPHWTAP